MERANEGGGPLTAVLLAPATPDGSFRDGAGGNDASRSPAATATATALIFLSTFVAACGQFGYGCAAGYSSPAESGIIEDLGLSTAEYSVFASLMTIGGILGATVNVKIVDLIGRRGAMWLSDIACIIGWIAIIFTKHVWWLDMGRLAVGFGCGIILYVTNVYVAEITPSNVRGGFVATNVMMLILGVSLMFFIGNIFTWRTLAIFGSLSFVVQFFGVFFIPESPRWLAKVGRVKDLEVTLKRLRGKDVDIYPELAEIIDYTKTFEQLSKGSIWDLFQRQYTHSLVIGVGIMLLVQFGGISGILFYASSIFEDAGASTSVGTTAMAIIQIPFTALNVLLVDKCGRRPLLMVSAVGTCLGQILVGLAFLMQDLHQPRETSAILVLCGVLLYSATLSAGLNATQWILVSEIFPINIKGPAGSVVVFSSSFGGLIVTMTFNFIFEWSSAGVFFIFAAFSGLIIPFVAKLVPETKGCSLEEIQASMAHLQSSA